ncbi:hypothetical protein TcCL_ESM08915, partial [Trypanosoma cruzi]
MQKSTTALRSNHTLPPVVFILVPPTHPLDRRRTSPAQPTNPTSADEQQKRNGSTCRRCAGGDTHVPQAPSMTHHPISCMPPTPRPQHVRKMNCRLFSSSQKPPQPESCAYVRFQRSRRSKACTMWRVF